MNRLVLSLLFFCAGARAQFVLQETDTDNRVQFLGTKWNASFFSLASAESDKFADEGGRLSTYNYLTFATRFQEDYRFALRVPFQYNSAGSDRFNNGKQSSQEIFLQDVIVGLQRYEVMMLPWDMGLYWEGRFYLPTSPNSRETGLITRYRNEFIVSKVFTRRIEVEYAQKFSYYAQSRTVVPTSFTDENGFEVNTSKLTKRTELDHWVVAWYKFSPQTGVGWLFGAEDTTWNSSRAENKSKAGENLLKTGAQLRFALSPRANFILSYQDKVNRRENAGELGKFLAKNTEVALLSFVGF